MNMQEFNRIIDDIDFMEDEQKIIEVHQTLIGQSCKDNYHKIDDCAVSFTEKILNRDKNRSIVYHYNNALESFLKSKYLSDYFKKSILSYIEYSEENKELISILKGNKQINELTENEISLVVKSIQKATILKSNKKVNVAPFIMDYLYKLDGRGIISYIKKQISYTELAKNIIIRSGLDTDPYYYSGRDIFKKDINEENLVEIFEKLCKIDKNYAVNYLKMVKSIDILNATEFLNMFKKFAINGFIYEKKEEKSKAKCSKSASIIKNFEHDAILKLINL